MQHRLPAVIALMLAITVLAQGADPKWVKLRSANFELFTSAGERAGRRTIQEFERTRSFFRQAMEREVSSSTPVRIVLFRSKKEYLPYQIGEAADAYYLSRGDSDLIVMVAGNEASVPIHEYVHLLVRHSGLELPLWINEGIAELYSSMRQVGKQIVVGYVPPGRIAALREEKWLPLREVLQADHDSQHYTVKERAGKFYAESWALTHMLNLSQEYRSSVTELFQLLTAGVPSATALETVYGISIEKLQRELQSYVRQDRLSAVVIDIKLAQSAERPSAEPAAGLEVGLLLADLLANTNKADEARIEYERVSSENPEAPGPLEGLGYLEYRLGDKDQARTHLGRAFDLGSKNPRMLQIYAALQREVNDENIVMTLLRLVQASPEDVEARLVLGNHLIRNGSYAQAVAILGPIRNATADQARRALRMRAYARLMLNERESGERSARQLLDLARTPQEIEYARRLLTLLERDAENVDPDNARDGRPAAQDGLLHESGERSGKFFPNEPPASPGVPESQQHRAETSMVAGSFVRLDCRGNQARMELVVDSETVSLLIDDGGLVNLKGSDADIVDLHCGEQPPRQVVVRFLPSENTAYGTHGVVRTIEFIATQN